MPDKTFGECNVIKRVSNLHVKTKHLAVGVFAALGLIGAGVVFHLNGRLQSPAPQVAKDPVGTQISSLGHLLPAAASKYTTLGSKRYVGAKAFLVRVNYAELSGDALSTVESLRDRASAGDAEAAFTIYLTLSRCKSAMNADVGTRALDAYRKADALPSAVAQLEADLDACQGVVNREDLFSERWLERAADAGLIEAQLMYAIDPSATIGSASDMIRDPESVRRYKHRAAGYLSKAAGNGSVDALIRLANAYDHGILVPADPVLAYAYYAASIKANPGVPLAEQALDAYLTRVPANRREDAESLSRSIYSRCCQKRQ